MTSSFLAGKVAIVTGGGRGIGAATAAALARAGAKVTVAARSEDEIETTAKSIVDAGCEALAVRTDVSDTDQVQAMVRRTVDAFGRVDFLINCAAVVEPLGSRAWETDPEAWRRTIEIDLVGVFLVVHAVLPHMIRQRGGRILNVSSGLTLPRATAYCAARAGANSLVRILAAELRGTGVTANIVYPGVVDTRTLREFRAALSTKDHIWPAAHWQPPAQDPTNPARLLVWLCSPATAHLTGQVVRWNDPTVQRQLAWLPSA